MKEFAAAGAGESVQQSEVINKMIQKLEIESTERGTSLEQGVESSRKVANVIQYMISKEDILMVT